MAGKVDQLRQDVEVSIAKNEVKQDYNPLKQEGDTRQKIALRFVMFYFIILLIIIIGVPIYNALVANLDDGQIILDLNDVLLTYSSVIGAPLGFVVGYYFKTKSE